jgi:hypothetical protein
MADHHVRRLTLGASLQFTGEADFWHPTCWRWSPGATAGPHPSGSPVLFTHRTCGHDTTATVVCSACAAPLTRTEIDFRPGPGSPPPAPPAPHQHNDQAAYRATR